ncbi:MAG: protein translocase subunit SecDF [Verrucomicrobiales bacterium]|nr:protein translocase subunit SecDF [Verrucomicrobiales bacterium]|tara:strand:- start:249 stop:2777 length:2529 start_codon:yes stop_codon:yes gene_type:complete
MKRNNTFRTFAVLFVIAWAFYEMTPMKDRSVIEVFQERALKRDEAFNGMVSVATNNFAADTNVPPREYRALMSAVGTNQLTNYFNFSVKGERDPNQAILSRLQKESRGRFRKGLDLQGGSSFIVGLDSNTVARVADTAALQDQAISVLRARVDKFGVAEPIIRAEGKDRIIIQMPGLSSGERKQVIDTLTQPAFLEFRMVHAENDDLVAQDLMAPGYEMMELSRKNDKGERFVERLLVKRKAELTGKYITQAFVDRDIVTMQPRIAFNWDSEGALIFAGLTRENIGNRLAIVLDGEVKSAPVIEGEIKGSGVINGDFTYKEASELAQVLENPLETPVSLLDIEEVDPTLGKASISSGQNAALLGIVAVAIFMLCYYIVPGFLANVALALNLVILLGVMCSLEATFTLPGIAGIVLTIGMAVDANVLIYERIREELRVGKSLRGALNSGYDKAWGTIFDSNVTTLIVSIILIYLGTGPVKGFGVTLTIGICASMFTALVVTRLLFDFLVERGIVKDVKMLSVVSDTKIEFLNFAKPAAIASCVILFLGVGLGIGVKGKSALGVDFVGGDALTYSFAKSADDGEIREAIAAVNYTDAGKEMTVGSDVTVQYQQNLGDVGGERLRITAPAGAGDAITSALQSAFADSEFKELSKRQVGAVIGKEILASALVSLILALFGILFYVGVRFEFSFSIAAVIAVLHDFLVTLGLFILVGGQLSAPIVAALLTIIGFSINDTIVIFDRIREDLKLGYRGTFLELINKAINQTLARTIITSGTTLFAVTALYLFGGGVIEDFALTLLIGVMVGTYSSIYVASATVLWWHKGERPKMSSPQVSGPDVGTATA